jgi:hypothetical protein
MATVVVGFVQPYKPMVESSSSAHTAGPASTGAATVGPASAGAASAGPASAGVASAGPASAGPVSAARKQTASAAADVKLPSGLSAAALSAGRTAGKQNPAQLKAAYSCLLDEFPAVVSASKRLPPVSHDVVHHMARWMAKSWWRRRLNSSS